MTEYLFIGTEDQVLKQWDIKEKKVVKIFDEIDPHETYLVLISDNGKYLFMASTNHELKQFDIKSGDLQHNFGTIADNFISTMKISSNNEFLFVSSMDETQLQFSLTTPEKKQMHTQPSENIFLMELAEIEGREYLFTISDGKILKQWVFEPKLTLYKDWGPVEGPESSIESIVYSKLYNSQFTTFEGVISQWDIKTEKLIRKIDPKNGSIMTMVIDPTGEFLFASSEDGKQKQFRILDGVCFKDWSDGIKINGLEDSIAISPDGEWLFTANECEMVQCWSLINEGVVMDIEETYGGWYSLFSIKY